MTVGPAGMGSGARAMSHSSSACFLLQKQTYIPNKTSLQVQTILQLTYGSKQRRLALSMSVRYTAGLVR